MYSDPYRGSYHLRCLTEAEILSSLHYRRMTSAQRHGSNYIIQAHKTPAARQHQRPSTFSFLSPFFLHFLYFCSSFSIFYFFPLHTPPPPPPPLICSLQHCQHRLALSLIHSTISTEGGEIYNGL